VRVSRWDPYDHKCLGINHYLDVAGNDKKLDKIIEKASHIYLVLSGVLIVIMIFTATYGVARRYLFNSPEPYSYEISTMFLLFSFVFAISAVGRLNRNIRVDFISGHLAERAQHVILNSIAPIMGLFFAIMLTWKGVEISIFSYQIGEVSTSPRIAYY